MKYIPRIQGWIVALSLIVGTPGCGLDLANLTASLGGTRVGQRGQIQLVFINNTAYRVVATFGTYDQLDQADVPDVEQFGPDDSDRTLDADEVSDILSIDCGRVFAIGSPGLLERIEENRGTAGLDTDALLDGMAFVETAGTTASASVKGVVAGRESGEVRAQEVGGLPQFGRAAAFEALLGVDFPCGALLILRLEENIANGEAFVVDFELIPSESTR